MKIYEYDLKVIMVVKALRNFYDLKQYELAEVLCLERSVYSKIEHGERALTIGELRRIAKHFKITVFEIFLIAEADVSIDFKKRSLEEILKIIETNNSNIVEHLNLNSDNLTLIIQNIKNSYSKIN